MNHANMINVFDAVTGGIDGSASVDDWEDMSEAQVRETAANMADNCYDTLSSDELSLVTSAIIESQKVESNNEFRIIRSRLDD